MSKRQQHISLFDPSLHYFCNICRKSLKDSVRVIVRLNEEFGCLVVNLCPPCLAKDKYVGKVEQYYVCRKVGRPLDRSSKVTASQALQSIHTIQQEGIEQMFLRGLNPQDRMYHVYKELNKQVFRSDQLKMKINFDDCKIPIGGIERQKPNPTNRKHLKALGYNWERQEFSFQPENIFGYLMGCFQEQEEQTEQDVQLRNIIFNYYDKEVNTIKQVNDFLVNSPFLLARKAIYDLHQVPKQLSDLRQIQGELKELVTQICNLTVQEDASEKRAQETLKNGKKHKNKKNHKDKNKHSGSPQKEDKDNRSRTRQKKQNKKRRNHSPNHKNQVQVPPPPLPEPQNLDKSSVSESGSVSESIETKRKRGRPKGSKSKNKVQRRKRKDRIFELKMDIDHKIGNKKQRIQKKRDQKDREVGQFRRKRKMSQDNSGQDEQNYESSDEN